MNILRFIQSCAVREYLEKINYKFNAKECAWLVFQCKTVTLAERHAAWQEIIDTMPDCEIVSKYLPHRSLHKFLKQYMEIENRAIERFFDPKDDAFYQFSWSYACDDYRPYYKTVDECLSAAAKFHNENDFLSPEEDEFAHIDIAKLYDGNVQGRVKFKPDGQIISTLPISLSEEESLIYRFVFKDIHCAFPCPFNKGDILFDVRRREYPNHNLMVFDRIDASENGEHCAYGYVMDDGYIMQDGFDCLNLEYYKSDYFAYEYRVLVFIRKYLLGKLSLTGLINKCHQILCEELAKSTEYHLGLWENDTVDEEFKPNWFYWQTQFI